MNKTKLAVQYFARLVLVTTVAIKFIWDAFYFAHHFHSLAIHLLKGLLGCPLSLPGALFLSYWRFDLFSLRRCGMASPGWSLVPELHVSSFRHAAWLNFAGFHSSGDFFAYRILACTCRGSQLFSFLEVLGNNSCNPFYRWFSWDRTIVCPDAFFLHSIKNFQPVSVWWCVMTDIDIWKHTWDACLCNK